MLEKENIYTLDAKGEVMITIMSRLAQEESRSISENVTWGKRRSIEEGRFSFAYKYFLGYKKGEDGILEIVEEEAKIVREIYQMFLDGKTIRTIADYLTGQGIPTPMGKEKWSVSTITSILTNEKYKGDALLQKTYTADFLTKSVRKNHGEVTQYYIKDSHPAIIDPETFNLVQKEMERRRPNRHKLHRSSPFTAKIICGDCGGYYGRKVWHSNSKHRKYIWRCNQKYETVSGRKEQIRRCLDELRECGDILEDFDLDLWNSMVESVTVYANKKLVFLFRDGTKVTVLIPEKQKMTKTT